MIGLGAAARRGNPHRGVALAGLAATGLGGGAWLAASVAGGGLYRPGDRFGYWLGVVGVLLLAPLLAYPLRKRVQALWSLGAMRVWVHWHLAAGSLAAVVLLFHATFGARSFVGVVGLWSMVVAMTSGAVAHFLYRRGAGRPASRGPGDGAALAGRPLELLADRVRRVPWRDVHVPAVLLFLVAGVVHVIAVHRY